MVSSPAQQPGISAGAGAQISEIQRGWEAVADSLEQLVLQLDKGGIILRGNRTVEHWGLAKVTEIRGRHFHKLLHPGCHDAACYMNIAWRHAMENLARNQPYAVDARDPILDRTLRLQFLPVFHTGEHPLPKPHIAVTAVLQDINKSDLMNEHINKAADELKTIFQCIPDNYLQLDEDGAVQAYKEGNFTEIFTIKHSPIGSNIRDILPDSLKEKYMEAIETVKSKRTLKVIEYTCKTGRETRIFEARFIPLFDRRVDIINRDITENKRLLSIAHNVTLTKSLGYIFSGIRHEIGNPINSIKMAMSVMRNNIDGFPRERILEYIDRVQGEINRVEYLLKNLKAFNMFEELSPKSIRVAQFMEKFLPLVEKDFKAVGIAIVLHITPDVTQAYADPRALHQVLLNILTNASEALDGVTDPRIDITIDRHNGKVRLCVTDNGHGISEAHLQEIFKPFFTTRPQGSGLGLSIVQKIIYRMNGAVTIDSLVNTGTTVAVEIPENKHVTS